MIVDIRKEIELRRGGKIVGSILVHPPVFGDHMVFPLMPSPLKQVYGRRYESISVPIAYEVVKDDGIEYTVRRYLDVRKKSKRQIEMLKTWKSSR